MSAEVGIALCIYNPEPAILRLQLESLTRQTFTDFIVRIQADSPFVPLALEAPDERFVWVQNQSRLGFKRNFETCVSVLSEQGVKYIALCDQDDLWDPDKLETLVKTIRAKPPLSLIHSDLRGLAQNGAILFDSVWSTERRNVDQFATADLLVRNVVTGCSSLFDARIANLYGKISESCDYHDHWYALAASVEGGVYPVHRTLMSYRQHPGNTSGGTHPYTMTLPNPAKLLAASRRHSDRLQKLHRVAQDLIRINPSSKKQLVPFSDANPPSPAQLFESVIRSIGRDPGRTLAYLRLCLGSLPGR